MIAKNINDPLTVAIIGMPGSGTTIITSLVNSIDRSVIFGEPHRIQRKIVYESRYGHYPLRPGNILEQINRHANDSNLLIRGFKEVWNYNWIDPIKLVVRYGEKLDAVLVVLREPLRNYASMRFHGHNRNTPGTEKKNIIRMYRRYCALSMSGKPYVPILYDNILKDPIGELNRRLCWGIAGKPALELYTGGGHRGAMASKGITKSNPRPPSKERGLELMVKAYEAVVLADSTLGCGPGSESSNLSGLPFLS